MLYDYLDEFIEQKITYMRDQIQREEKKDFTEE
jgi:hypothetical protein